MKETDCAYIAALIDSIGTLKIEPPKKGEVSCLYVWITRANFKLMEYLQRFGAYIVDMGEGQFRAKWKDQGACRLIKSIIHFSREKREQLSLGIEFFEAKTSEQKEVNFDLPFRLRLKLLKQTEE